MHFVHIPWVSVDGWSVLPADMRGPCTTACWRTTSWAFTPSAGGDCSPKRPRRSPAARRRRSRARSPSTRPSSTRSRPTRRFSTAGPGSRQDAAGTPGRTRRSYRSLEEHPAWLPSVRAPAREPPGASRARRDARAARSLSPGHPRVRRVPGGDRARGGRCQRAGRGDGDRPPDRGRLPAVGRRVHGVRRAVREPDLRRAQPRREGGPAAERAGTGCSCFPRTQVPRRSSLRGRSS